MDGFTMNGYSWRVCYVDADDPMLVDRTGRVTVATTEPGTLTVYILRDLDGAFLSRVLIHELGHCAMFSFGLLDDIHQMVHPRYWLEVEEWVCNFIADYGMTIFDTAYAILGDRAIAAVPYEVERLVA